MNIQHPIYWKNCGIHKYKTIGKIQGKYVLKMLANLIVWIDNKLPEHKMKGYVIDQQWKNIAKMANITQKSENNTILKFQEFIHEF